MRSETMPYASKPLQKEINITELLRLLWRRRILLGIVTSVVMVLVLLFHFTLVPQYLPSSVVLIKTDKSKSSAAELLDPFGSLAGITIENDIELLKSFPLAEATVRSLYYSNERDSLELFGNRHYRSPVSKLFAWIPKGSSGEERPALSKDQTIRKYAATLQKRVMVSNSRDTDILEVSVASPFPDEAALLTNALCRAYLKKDIEWNADQALQVKGFVSEQLAEQKSEIQDVDARLTAYMQKKNIYELTGNAENLLNKLVEAESRYNDARSEYNILKKRQDFIARKLSEEEKAFTAKVARSVDRQAQELKSRIRQEETGMIGQGGAGGANNQQLSMLKQRLQEVTRNAMAGELAFSTKARQFQFDLISEQLQTDIRLAELNYIAQEYERSKNHYNGQLSKLPQKQLEYARLQRDREVLNNTYTFLKGKLEESRIQIASEVGKVVIVGAAYPPERPVAPSLRKNLLIGLMLALGIGGVLVGVLESLDHTLRDDSFIEEHGYITLSTIPYVGNREPFVLKDSLQKNFADLVSAILKLSNNGNGTTKGKPTNGRSSNGSMNGHQSSAGPNPVLIVGQLSTHLAESFRDLRTNIIFSKADATLKSILVTGTEIGEGKSTVCLNLAYSFALIGKRVLVVDCDLRRPSQHTLAGLHRLPGLTEYLTGVNSDMQKVIRRSEMHENLFLFPAGSKTPNPNELLGSERMTELLTELENTWDLVLIDSPPLLMLSDAALLSKSVGGILMVARVGYSSRHMLKEVQKVDYIKKNLLGVAIIGPSDIAGYGKYGRYYGRYSHKGYYSPFLSADAASQDREKVPS